MIFIWIGLIITLILIELLRRNLVTIWYVISSILSLILSLFIDSYIIQFLVFSILGTILLLYCRDYFFNLLMQNKEKILIGKIATVYEEINKKKIGKVKIGNKKYKALSNKKIKNNKNVKVIGINGSILKVEEVKK